ncbi:Glycosyl transferase family 2 [Pedobacter hartonius]|uniref:Glycosyl transferase family 2 n=1 Tax=Pedobacter hartonius TaxID=425514 RepID=A0A1H4HLD4_9SPHI|nr:Glycosyl transferase family 2 [Pedobacter hartonius]
MIIFDDGVELSSLNILDLPNIHYYYAKASQEIGPKRNFLCSKAQGEIIIHLDDDDWYAPDWISKQVNALNTLNTDITGINNINFFSTVENIFWNYKYTENIKPWIYGGTLAYWKSLWDKNPFKDMQTGEDNDFIFSSKAKIYAHDYTTGYLGLIHGDNIGVRLFENPAEKLQQEKWIKNIQKPEKYHINTVSCLNSNLPLVTCIMPTANRPNFVISAIDNFIKQNYSNKELVIIDDGKESVENLIPNDQQIKYFFSKSLGTIGSKRNIACDKAKGEFIIHWDDDDWYAPDWIVREVEALLNSGADICGIDQVQFFSPSQNEYWMTKNRNSKHPWLTGATLIYRKSFWNMHNFNDLQSGEDDDFVRNSRAKIFAHSYFQGFIATLHDNNTSSIFFE